jgi:hypothetical protein
MSQRHIITLSRKNKSWLDYCLGFRDAIDTAETEKNLATFKAIILANTKRFTKRLQPVH